MERQAVQAALTSANATKAAQIDEQRSAQIRKDMLQHLQQNYEGFSRATKAVLTAKHAWRTGIYGAIGELVQAVPEQALAIETALGMTAQNLVCADDETGQRFCHLPTCVTMKPIIPRTNCSGLSAERHNL